jgi:hypothetical protein
MRFMTRWSIRGYMLAVGYAAGLIAIAQFLCRFFCPGLIGGH